MKFFFSYSPPPGINPPPPPTPLPRSRFRVVFWSFRVDFESFSSRDSKSTRKRLVSDSLGSLVAQCSATPATVAATPPCSATPFQTKFRCDTSRDRGGGGGARCDTKIFRGCSATLVLHLQNAIKSRKSAATRVARHV